jgi:DNA-binding transcriptional LysR family regulator
MRNLEPILIFLTVAEMGSFTRAADSLGIQKGRASTAVRKLEEDVGVRLLHRTTRSVQLTEDGRAFHARARDLLAEVDDLHSMFAGDHVALRGRLRVDLPTEIARTTIVPALPDFMAAHPELELEMSRSLPSSPRPRSRTTPVVSRNRPLRRRFRRTPGRVESAGLPRRK